MLRYLKLLLMIVLLSACGRVAVPPISPSPPPPSALPDLVISKVYLGMQGIPDEPGSCVPAYAPYEIRATVKNLGQAPAYNISVLEVSTNTRLQVGELGAGQSIELYFPANSPSAAYRFNVDVENTIPEIDEKNNSAAFFAPTPTPPAICTPAQPAVQVSLLPAARSPGHRLV